MYTYIRIHTYIHNTYTYIHIAIHDMHTYIHAPLATTNQMIPSMNFNDHTYRSLYIHQDSQTHGGELHG